MNEPKVFVSHASEDKPFVRRFAESLRARGVDAWVDEWELLPGDRLIQKVFDEGLKNAAAIIVVISPVSITKPWVREELDAALVTRINRGSKLIPVVIGDVEVPVALASTVWVRVADVENFTSALDQVVSAIFDIRTRPALGQPPPYAARQEPVVPGLTKIDSFVLRLFGDGAVAKGRTLGVDTESCWDRAEAAGITRADFLDSLEILERRGYLKRGPNLAPVPHDFSVTVPGFEAYVAAYVPGYAAMFESIVFEIVNHSIYVNSDLAKKLGIEVIFVNHALDELKLKRLAEIEAGIGGYKAIYRVMPELKRWLATAAARRLTLRSS